jgi:hypothetical protein
MASDALTTNAFFTSLKTSINMAAVISKHPDKIRRPAIVKTLESNIENIRFIVVPTQLNFFCTTYACSIIFRRGIFMGRFGGGVILVHLLQPPAHKKKNPSKKMGPQSISILIMHVIRMILQLC